MREFVIQERRKEGDDRDFDGTNPDLTDTYEVSGTLQDAIERLAEVSDNYGGSYSHRLIEIIPVKIERLESADRNATVSTCGDVRVSTTAV